MAISQIGTIIKRRRIELGLSQEDLSDGICAVTTLSRIESCERMPTQNHLELLLQRIGYSEMMLQSYVTESEFLAHELKFKIRQSYMEKDVTTARKLLQQFEAIVTKPSPIEKQFVLLHRVLLYPDRYSLKESLQELEWAICLTCTRYKQGRFPFLLSYDEIVLLNNIAITYAECSRGKEAVNILYSIADYYDSHMVNAEEALRTEPMTLYNLSKYLGLENRYNECIAVCERGIRLAQTTGRCQCFAQTLYNKAWALVKRNQGDDLAQAKILAHHALNVANAFGNSHFASHCQRFIETNGFI